MCFSCQGRKIFSRHCIRDLLQQSLHLQGLSKGRLWECCPVQQEHDNKVQVMQVVQRLGDTLPTMWHVLQLWSASSLSSSPPRVTPSPPPTSSQTTPGSTSPSTRSWCSPTCWGWSPWQYSECDNIVHLLHLIITSLSSQPAYLVSFTRVLCYYSNEFYFRFNGLELSSYLCLHQ